MVKEVKKDLQDVQQRFHIYVRNGYIGACDATLAQIKAAFPWSAVIGRRVDVYAMAR